MHVKDALSTEVEEQMECPSCGITNCEVVAYADEACNCTNKLNWVGLKCVECGVDWIVDYHLSDCKNKRTGQ